MRIPWPTFLLTLLLAFCLLLTGASTAYAQDKSFVFERFDVDIVVNADGTFDVVEHQGIRFTSGTFTFGYREIPIRYFSYIDNWRLTDESGHTYTLDRGSQQPYTFSLEESASRYVIRWYFPPMANASETYTLRYRVHGGLRYYDEGDQIWWKAIYGERSAPVLAGRVRVIMPERATIQQWAAYINGQDARDAATATLVEGNRAVLFDLTRRLNGGEEFEVRVQFTPGVVDGAPQPWQQAADAEAARREAELALQERWRPIATLGFGALGLLLMLGGPALLYALWYRFGRDQPVEMVADYLPEPPDDLPPGLAGTLLDETVDMEDILATIVDLARRKVISITEEKTEGFFRTGTDFIYRRERDDVPLRPFEEELLKALFGRKEEVRLSDLKNKFYNKLPRIRQQMYQAVVDAGLFPRSPESVRNQYGCLAVFGLFLAAGVAFVLMAAFGNLTGAAILPGVGLGVTAVGLLILSRAMPRKTHEGALAAARWRAFKEYLRHMERYTDVEVQKEIWDRWLPYAIAFGIDKEYIRKFEAVDAPAPGWYIPS
ncbi:hypothetical protein RY27_20105, partial [Litorilinea aerophila]